jgi:hypothetical protein
MGVPPRNAEVLMRQSHSMKSTALAIVLAVAALSARAEAVTLLCQDESGDSWTFRVDYDRQTVGFLRPDGTAYFSAPALITEGDVKWDAVVDGYGGQRFAGNLNRLTGRSKVSHPGGGPHLMKREGMCRRATQKF